MSNEYKVILIELLKRSFSDWFILPEKMRSDPDFIQARDSAIDRYIQFDIFYRNDRMMESYMEFYVPEEFFQEIAFCEKLNEKIIEKLETSGAQYFEYFQSRSIRDFFEKNKTTPEYINAIKKCQETPE
jgi:hypothetical protein